jgi:hypothetical protein
MILRRLGNKKKIAKKIQAYFPPHKIYIEPFLIYPFFGVLVIIPYLV